MPPVTIKPSPRAKRMCLRFDAAVGAAVLTVPIIHSPKEVQQFLNRSQGWLLKQQEKASPPLPKGTMWFRGEIYTIQVNPHLSRADCVPGHPIAIDGEKKMLTIASPPFIADGTLQFFIQELAQHRGKSVCDTFAKRIGIGSALKRVAIKDYQSRWGCCYPKRGTIFLSWRLGMAPESVFDYVCAHEVAHLKIPNHTQDFWTLVADLMPHYASQRLWLKRHGHQLLHGIGNLEDTG